MHRQSSAAIILSAVLVAFLAGTEAAKAEAQPLQRIAFGSCARQDQPQPIWDAILQASPQVFIFLGDNIYADTEDMNEMRAKYALLANQPGYQKLKRSCTVLATWDDHDYGQDDAGVEYPKKRQSQQIFLDFFDVPQDSPRRQREGVYHAQTFGPSGRRVQVILLDTRYHRSPLTRGFEPGEPGEGIRGRYVPGTDPSATILGPAQWTCLEEQLRQPAEVRIICSSIQVIANEHGWEKWGNLPAERSRLMELIDETGANGVIFISGDRHLSELSRIDPPASGVRYPLYDLTSSSLNAPSRNITKAGTRFVNELNSHRVGLVYFDTNFGMIDIDWSQPDPELRLQIRDEAGDVPIQQRVRLSQLK
jgi:alkaline phosphatase D